MIRVISAAVLLSFLLAHHALALVTDFDVRQVDNTAGGPPLNGFVTNDVSIDFSGRFGGAAILLELQSGSIFQDTLFGGDVIRPPTQGAIGFQPSLAFDTFLAQGGPTAETSLDDISLIGGAVNLGAEPAIQFDTERLNITFDTAAFRNLFDQTDFLLSRITLSEDAQGTFALYVLTDDDPSTVGGTDQIETFDVVNGRIVPEPAAGLLGIVILAASGRLTRARAC